MAGANLTAKQPYRVAALIMKALGERKVGRLGLGAIKTVFTKAGVPASDTAADAPNHKGDWCYDTTNSNVYLCTAYTSSSSFTWTKAN